MRSIRKCRLWPALQDALTEVFLSGVWDGLSPEEAKQTYPDEWERFLSDPYAHRAPRAESYHDLSGEYPRGMRKLTLTVMQSDWSRSSLNWNDTRMICSSSGMPRSSDAS